MGRLAALSIFSSIGFTIGFLTYLAFPTISILASNAVPSILLGNVFIGAIAAGVAGLAASLALVTRWARKS